MQVKNRGKSAVVLRAPGKLSKPFAFKRVTGYAHQLLQKVLELAPLRPRFTVQQNSAPHH
jgi:hypothetical protein